MHSGLAPALLRQAIYGTVKYGLYYTIKDVIGGEESPLKNVSIAVIAGSVSASIANPTDVLKVRLQSRSAPVVSPRKVIRVSLYNCFRDIYMREGVGGLWRGVMPTASRAALVAGVQVSISCSAVSGATLLLVQWIWMLLHTQFFRVIMQG